VAPSRSVVRKVVESNFVESSPRFMTYLDKIASDNVDPAAEATNSWLERLSQSTENRSNSAVVARDLLVHSYIESSNRAFPHGKIRPDEFIRRTWDMSGQLRRACELDLRCAISALGLGLLSWEEFFTEHGIAGIISPQQLYDTNYLSPIAVALLSEMFGLQRRVVDIATGRDQAIRATAHFVRKNGWSAVRLAELPEEMGSEPSAGVDLFGEVWPGNLAEFENFTAEQQYVAIFLMCLLTDLYGEDAESINLDRDKVVVLIEQSEFIKHSDREQVEWWLAGNRLTPRVYQRDDDDVSYPRPRIHRGGSSRRRRVSL
jgi:hypothetical protein